MARLIGAYSLAILTTDAVYGLRDPKGVRPLCIGKLGDKLVVLGPVTYTQPVQPPAARNAKSGFKPPVPITYTVEVTGKLDGILAYLNNLETFPNRVLAVNSITLKPRSVSMPTKGNLPNYGNHTVKLEIQAYFMADQTTGALR